MTIPAIKACFIADIKKDEPFKLRLAQANDVKISSIDRWLRTGDETLTTVRNLNLIKEYFGVLETQELLEESFIGEAA